MLRRGNHNQKAYIQVTLISRRKMTPILQSSQDLYVGAVPPGAYWIRNAHSKGALDLMDSNPGTLITNNQITEQPNQEWILESGIKGYKFLNAETETYMGFTSGDLGANNSSVSGNLTAIEWEVVKEGPNYKIRLASNTSLVLELADWKMDSGNKILVSPDNGHETQNWILEWTDAHSYSTIGPGTFWIRNAHSNAALDLTESNPAPGAPVTNYQVTKYPNQKWILEAGTGGFKIKNSATNTYLSIVSNLPVTQYRNVSCNPFPMEWEIIRNGSNYSIRVFSDRNLALDLAGGFTFDRNSIILWPYHGGETQQWIFENAPASASYVGALPQGAYWIRTAVSKTSGLTLCNSAPGTIINNYQATRNPNQKWILESGANGYTIKNALTGTYMGFPTTGFQLKPLSPVSGNPTPVEWVIVEHGSNFRIELASNRNLVLDLYDAATTDGNIVVVYNWYQGLHQQWIIEHA